jgi:hypothetical protein
MHRALVDNASAVPIRPGRCSWIAHTAFRSGLCRVRSFVAVSTWSAVVLRIRWVKIRRVISGDECPRIVCTISIGTPPASSSEHAPCEAEALAATGNGKSARTALDNSAGALPAQSDETFQFLSLNDAHFARWRGHCLARLGATEAVDDLTAALAQQDPSFSRAAASLRCDLALAYSVRGQHQQAREEARKADEFAARTASVRQRRRIARLLASGQT